MIRKVNTADMDSICRIYNYYVEKSIATFEEEPVIEKEMAQRIKTATTDYPWLVYESDGKITGYAYGRKWHERSAYRFSCEIGIYLDKSYTGKGIGRDLLSEITGLLKNSGLHCLIAGIALPNTASVRLFEKAGFSQVAHYRETGYKFGKWIDVGYWEKILK